MTMEKIAKKEKNVDVVIKHFTADLKPPFWSLLEPANPAQLRKDSYITGPPGYIGWTREKAWVS
jgi:hypothetical protein